MRKITLLFLSILTMGQLQAYQEPPFTYHLGGYFGQNFADKSSRMRDNALFGIRGTVMLTPFYGINIGYERLNSIDIKESTSTIDVDRFYGQIEVDGEEQYHVVPYITLGAGYELLSSDIVVDGRKYDVSQAYISGGLGFRYNFIPELSIFVEGNALWKTDTTDLDTNLVGGLVYHVNATTCDDTYVTERLKERPSERTTLHVGAVNPVSGWKKSVTVPARTAAVRKPPFRTTATTPVVSTDRSVPISKRVSVVPVKQSNAKKKKKAHIQKKRVKTHKVSHSGGYYVLLGAYKTKSGLQSMLKKLRKNHVPYMLRDNQSRKLTYVMAGVYPDLLTARKALGKLKKIQPDAYIRRMK